MAIEGRHHAEQVSRNSCVAACVGMIRRARGELHDEAALMARSTEDGLSMAVAAGEVRGRFHAWLSPEDLLAMLGFLAGERGLIVKVSGPVYVKWKGTEPGGHASSFGELAAPGDFGRPFHAILLLDLEGECVRYLDPWYPSAGQPLSMSRDDLVAMYVGAAVDVRL